LGDWSAGLSYIQRCVGYNDSCYFLEKEEEEAAVVVVVLIAVRLYSPGKLFVDSELWDGGQEFRC